jgi:hypothetical protein
MIMLEPYIAISYTLYYIKLLSFPLIFIYLYLVNCVLLINFIIFIKLCLQLKIGDKQESVTHNSTFFKYMYKFLQLLFENSERKRKLF